MKTRRKMNSKEYLKQNQKSGIFKRIPRFVRPLANSYCSIAKPENGENDDT